MRISNAVRYPLTAFVTLTLLAGCSGGSSQMAPTPLGPGGAIQSEPQQAALNRPLDHIAALRGFVAGHGATTRSFMDPSAVGKPLVFIANFSHAVVDIYLQAPGHKMLGEIGGFDYPTGLATDIARNLYVANSGFGMSNNVLVYAPPYTAAPKLTLDDAGYEPNGVAVSPRGVVAVANTCTAPSCQPNTGNFVFYAKNATTPCATVAATSIFPLFDAFNDKGDLYVIGYSTGKSFIGKITGGCRAKHIALLTTNNNIFFAADIHITKSDRIALLVQVGSGAPVIYTYNPPNKGSLGNPVSTTPLTTLNQTNVFTFVASGADLYTGEVLSGSAGALANKYDYPVGGSAEDTVNAGPGNPFGIAVTPPLVP